jgi:hypothetical protein
MFRSYDHLHVEMYLLEITSKYISATCFGLKTIFKQKYYLLEISSKYIWTAIFWGEIYHLYIQGLY